MNDVLRTYAIFMTGAGCALSVFAIVLMSIHGGPVPAFFICGALGLLAGAAFVRDVVRLLRKKD